MVWLQLIIIILVLQHVIKEQNMELSYMEHFHYFSWVFLCSAVSSAKAKLATDLLAQYSLQEQHALRQSLCLYSACLFGFVLINPVIGIQKQ